MSTEPTVSIIDDDAAFRESLVDLVLSMGLKAKAYANGDQFFSAFDPSQPGCLILDVDTPHLSNLTLQEKLTRFPLCPPVIVLAGHSDLTAVLRALKQGAVECLQKSFADAELRESIRRAVTLDDERRQTHQKRETLRTRVALLTRPELQVRDLVVAGYPNKQIASTLGVSRRAVEDRRARVMRKLNVDTLPALVRLAVEAEG